MDSREFIRIVWRSRISLRKDEQSGRRLRRMAGFSAPGLEMHPISCKCTLFRGNAAKSESASRSESILCLDKSEQVENGPRGGGGATSHFGPDRPVRKGRSNFRVAGCSKIICKGLVRKGSRIWADRGRVGIGSLPGCKSCGREARDAVRVDERWPTCW